MATPSQTLTGDGLPGPLERNLFPTIFSPQDPRLGVFYYPDADENLGLQFEQIVFQLDPTIDHREEGTTDDGYWTWFKLWERWRQEAGLDFPFGHHLITYAADGQAPFVIAACGIVLEDRYVKRDHGVPGEGFWAGTVIRHGFEDAGLWQIMWDYRGGICQSYAQRLRRDLRFNLITSAPQLVPELTGSNGFIPDGKLTVSILGEVDLLYREFRYTPPVVT